MSDDQSPWHEVPTPDLEEELEHKLAQQQALERQTRLRSALTQVRELETELAEAEVRTADWERAITDLRALFIDAAIEWLAAKWGAQKGCPYCGNDEWTISVPVNLLLESRETLPPHFTATCTNCANTVFINAVQAGLFPDDGQE